MPLLLPRLLSTALLAPFLLASAQAQTARPSLTGTWTGEVAATNFIIHITEPATGPGTATLDMPDRHATGVPMKFRTAGDSVYLRLLQPAAQFAGRRSASGQQLVGEWQQGLRSFPFTLSREEVSKTASAAPRRPQQPAPPFPYQSVDITFKNEKDNVTLAGTYTVPADMGPFPAVVLLTGSGPEDRNSTFFGHQPFAVLADYLSRHGVAVLRFDDRGVGGSGGDTKTMTSAEYATDAQAALAWLRAQHGIRKNQVGLIGHSQGGTAAIGAATQANGPDFLVLLSAPGMAGDEMMMQQVLAQARLSVTDPAQLASIEKVQRSLYQIVQKTPDNAQAKTLLMAAYDPTHSIPAAQLAELEPQLAALTSPAYRGILADRPAQTLSKVHCPVLALGGSKDLQVVAKPNLAAIAAGLKAAKNPDVTVKELPGLNHLFQTAATGAVGEYATIEETFAPAALQAIGDWISAHTKK